MPESTPTAQPGKWRELLEEFRLVVGTGGLLDAILPPVIFLLVNALFGFGIAMGVSLGLAGLIAVLRLMRGQSLIYAGFGIAMGVSLGLAGLIAVLRLMRGQSLIYAVAGIGSVGLAIGIVWVLGRAEGYFLPNLVSGGLTFTLALISLLIRRPFVAWTSYIARRWPLDWYWHPRVRPAYSEVTLVWTVFFGARLLWQVSLFQARSADLLAFVNALLGWPAIVVLLVFSYLYGTWRLKHLKGPSTEEFKNQSPPPWKGQERGF
jgi:hypothetical protein